MKDFFDLWLLTRQPELNKEVLSTAIKRTFANRGMEIDRTPIGLSPASGDDPAKQMQWSALLTGRGSRKRRAASLRSSKNWTSISRRFFLSSSHRVSVIPTSPRKYGGDPKKKIYFLVWGMLWGKSPVTVYLIDPADVVNPLGATKTAQSEMSPPAAAGLSLSFSDFLALLYSL
jgi:hypothetical protein